jgi:hypothetical protein
MFCNAKKLAPESEQSFSRKLKKEFGLKDAQMRDEKNNRAYYWIGIRIKDSTSLPRMASRMLLIMKVSLSILLKIEFTHRRQVITNNKCLPQR